MLSRELMGALALGILWVNTLLIAGAAWQRIRALAALRSRLETDGVKVGTIARGDGPDGAIAAHRVDQIGRAGGEEGTIVFGDRAYASEIFGGTVTMDAGGELAIAKGSGDVWLDRRELETAGACPSEAAFDRAIGPSKKARGFERTVTATLGEGARVFVSGDGDAMLVATMDPSAWLSRKVALGLAFIVGDLAGATACTVLALHQPRFGLVSTVGGVLGLAFFLLIQPAGTALRDAVLVPSRAILRGTWARARAAAEGGAVRA